MRKITAFLLILVMVCSLFGCNKAEPTKEPPAYSLADLLVGQAVSMARQIGLSTEKSYLTAMGIQEEVAELASTFSPAATEQPVEAQLMAVVDENFVQAVTKLCSGLVDMERIACSGTLAFETQLYMPKQPKHTSVVYLRYSDTCHFIVAFETVGSGIASAWAYPLFADSVSSVLDTYFFRAEAFDATQIQQCVENAGSVDFKNECSGDAVDSVYYGKLAETVLKKAKTLTAKEISAYTTDKTVVSQAATFSRRMAGRIQGISVFTFPESVQTEVDTLLSGSNHAEDLRELTRQRMYLAWINDFCGTYDKSAQIISAVLRTALDTTDLGATSAADEAPVLVLVNLGDGCTALFAIYPNDYNTYLYNVVVIPGKYLDLQSALRQLGSDQIS